MELTDNDFKAISVAGVAEILCRMLPVSTARHGSKIPGLLRMAAHRARTGQATSGATSIPQYLTAVRQMHQLVTGQSVPKLPFVDIVQRAYGKWEEEHFAREEVRCGVPATAMMEVYELGMRATDLRKLRDCAELIFAYLFNGLRESSTMSLETAIVSTTTEALYARVSIWKGRRASS